uniref:SDR family oxidoreductase n=2 Tax=Litorilinea aerophila TaxID=1204385 RepID=A0A540VMY1_9CHLR
MVHYVPTFFCIGFLDRFGDASFGRAPDEVTLLMEISGKVALVTGGAHRVGRAITLMLAGAGAHVVVNYHTSADAAQQTVAEARALGATALALQGDVADWSAVQAMAATIQDHFGGVDIIVNSASLFQRTPFPTPEIDTWKRVTAVSIDGPFFVCNSLVPGMKARGSGVIVNLVDLSAWQPWPHFTAHAVGKAALLALTRQLALELAPIIRVNAVAAGPVLPPPGMAPDRAAAIAKRTLLGRWGHPDDVAQAVRYLIEADYVTGEVLTVDGGERYGWGRHAG